MKFDTNKTKASSCTKISAAQCYLMDNDSIPSGAHGWEWPTTSNNDDDDMIDMSGGRQVMYEPTVVFTPVYASMRQQGLGQGSTTEKRALLSWPGVKDVLSQLEALTLGTTNSPSNEGSIDNKVPAKKDARDDNVTGRYFLRGNRMREATTLAVGIAAPEPVVSAHYMPAAAASGPYQPTVRRSPRLHPEIAATSVPAKRSAPGPFGY